MCRSGGKGALLFATQLQDAQHRALAIRSSGWRHQEGASWEFAQHIPLLLQLQNSREWPCCLHPACASTLCTFTCCRQALSDQTVKYSAFCKVQWLLQTPLCALVVICTTLGASRKSQNLSAEASPSHRAAHFRCHSEVGTILAARPYFNENLLVETLLGVSDRNTVCQQINSSL